MRTWLDKKTGLWVSQRTESVWTGLVDINTGEKIFEGDNVSVEQYDYSSRKTIRKNMVLKRDEHPWGPVLEPELFQKTYKPIKL